MAGHRGLARAATKTVIKVIIDSMKWERSRTREPKEGKMQFLWV